MPFSTNEIKIELSDARKLNLKSGSVDLILTSPPYINVINYHEVSFWSILNNQQYRGSVELLNWDVLTIAKSEIGSNRKHRSNRFLTVIQYCLDMCQALQEMRRVLRETGKAIIIIGRESQVRKTTFKVGEIVQRLATECVQFDIETQQERVFVNRYGKKIFEEVLILVPVEKTTSPAIEIARSALESAKEYCAKDILCDLVKALSEIDDVLPSPIVKL